MPEFATRMEGITGSAIRAVFKLLAKGDIISFGGGNPSAESFPTEEIRSIVDSLLARDGANLLQYGPTEGYAPLRAPLLSTFLHPNACMWRKSRSCRSPALCRDLTCCAAFL